MVLCARRARTLRRCPLETHSGASLIGPLTREKSKEVKRALNWRRYIIIGVSCGLVACAGPEPLLRSNAHLQLQGREAAQDDVDACQNKAEAAGLKPGTSRSANAASGGTIGLVGGAAVGAVSGIIGGATGVAIGAAVGGGLGLIIGLAGGAYKPLEPDPPYADAVVRCLIEKGYEVQGWQ